MEESKKENSLNLIDSSEKRVGDGEPEIDEEKKIIQIQKIQSRIN